MNRSKLALSFFTLFSLNNACGVKPASSSLHITNGVLTQQPDRLKAVISQDGCTGTFVSPTTIITAAHCADHGFTYKGVKTKSWQSMPEALGKPWGFDIDVRLLVFPKAVAPAWIPISTTVVKGDEAILMAGFGTYDLKNHKDDGVFRYGTGHLDGFEADGQLMRSHGSDLEMIQGTVGSNSGVGPGDSGGPMLRDGLLIGVASAISGEGNDTHKSVHVNLTNPVIKAFLDAAVKSGIDIRFDGQGTVPFEECVTVDAQEPAREFALEVPHRTLKSVTGSWKICDDCALTDATGYAQQPFGDLVLPSATAKVGSLLVRGAHQFDAEDDTAEVQAWIGKAMSFGSLIFKAELSINDSDARGDNSGSMKVCFE